MVAATTSTLPATGNEEPTKAEYVNMAVRAWKHFQCAALAKTATASVFPENIFLNRGFQLGQTYLQAMEQSKINMMDLTVKVPLPFYPNDSELPIEFQLGRISKDAENQIALDIVAVDGNNITSFEEINVSVEKTRANARRILAEGDCDFDDLELEGETLENFRRNILIDFSKKLPPPVTSTP